MRWLIVFFLIALSSSAIADSLSDYHQSLDLYCQIDVDCRVKDIGNCCGYNPACVNKNATPDLNIVQAACEKEQMTSVCGFQDVAGCTCINNTCQASDQPLP